MRYAVGGMRDGLASRDAGWLREGDGAWLPVNPHDVVPGDGDDNDLTGTAGDDVLSDCGASNEARPVTW